jgi:hypothetical protein
MMDRPCRRCGREYTYYIANIDFPDVIRCRNCGYVDFKDGDLRLEDYELDPDLEDSTDKDPDTQP